VIISAEDSSGNVVWQHTWTVEEFTKLGDIGWKIIISSETNQLPATSSS
jgi:hypothetical protein